MMKTKIIITILSIFSMSLLHAQVPEKPQDISPLLIGERLPTATLQDADGKDVDVNRLLKEKPTVLVFYRGGWCPYCNTQLASLAKIEQQVLNLGYQILAISPDDYRNLKKTVDKREIKYKLLADKNGEWMKKIGIVFKTPKMVKGYISSKGQIGATSEVIPVPTLMIVDANLEISFEYINVNYKKRISEEMLIATLKSLKSNN